MRRPTISRDEFSSLKAGDLLLVNGRYLRTVVSPPSGPNGAVTLPIRHRSWTNRVYTVRVWNDLKYSMRKVGKTVRGLVLKSEIEILKQGGWDVRAELRRELKRAKEDAKRLGRPLCPGVPRLERLAKASK